MKAKFGQFVYGFYPIAERWRPNIVFALGAILLAGLLIPRAPWKRLNAILFFGIFPVLAFFLLYGGFGLPVVETALWGGLLVTLARHPGILRSHAELLSGVWGPTYGAETQLLRVTMRNLRAKLAAGSPGRTYIVTEYGLGYRFEPGAE